jgi:hypothetical protein
MVNTTANWREQTKAAVEMVAQGRVGEIRHVQLHMGAPLMMLFDDAARTTWVDGVGSPGRRSHSDSALYTMHLDLSCFKKKLDHEGFSFKIYGP